MRCVMNPGHAALAGMLAGLLSLPAVLAAEEVEAENNQKPSAEAADEELPRYSVSRVTKNVPVGTTDATVVINPEPELDLQFPAGSLIPDNAGNIVVEEGIEPASSNRRGGAWRQFWPVPQTEPGLFTADDERPLKPLPSGWATKPVWQAEGIDTWGAHPATPVPAPMPRLGLQLDNLDGILQVAGELPLETCKTKASCADKCGKCDKCNKCDVCKCENCPGEGCKGDKETQLEQGETAKVILELMETLGKSVLDGTVFQKPDVADQQWLKELSADGQVSPREALIQYIRHLETQQKHVRSQQCEEECELEVEFVSTPLRIKGLGACPGECAECPAECSDCRDCPGCDLACQACAHEAPRLGDAASNEVEVLREMSTHLDMAANELERREIYLRADQLREIAGQLRQDARRTSVARAKKGPVQYRPAQTYRDVHQELNDLREQLRRTQAELEHARGVRR